MEIFRTYLKESIFTFKPQNVEQFHEDMILCIIWILRNMIIAIYCSLIFKSVWKFYVLADTQHLVFPSLSVDDYRNIFQDRIFNV